MKAQFASYSILKKIVSVSLFAALFAMPALAGDKKSSGNGPDKGSEIEKQVNVQYAGYTGNAVVFKVKYESPVAQKFVLVIKNAEGEVLYREQVNGSSFSRTIHLLKEAAEMYPTFICQVGGEKVERSFAVNLNTREDVLVNKL